jgi:AAA domain
MSQKPKVYTFKTMKSLVSRLRDELKGDPTNGGQDFVLLYAYNGTGKTRLSMAFKEAGKKKDIPRDTLYFNAFTEDLFSWDNDLQSDSNRVLKINSASRFFAGFKELALEEKIFLYLERYADFNFRIDYDNWTISFSCEHQGKTVDNIKISRGEENIFIWCVFLAIVQLAMDGAESYNWVKYLYIDDPISSLDDNNAIAVASDLAQMLKQGVGKIKTVISSHHGLFFNVICNELKTFKHKTYFLHKTTGSEQHTLRATNDTPFFHHVAMLSELSEAAKTDQLYTYHFNMLRSILEKTATFFGFKDFSDCIEGVDDETLYSRALNLLSHGKYSVYEPREMVQDTKELFKRIFNAFLGRYRFNLPELLSQPSKPEDQPVSEPAQRNAQATTTASLEAVQSVRRSAS